MVRGAGCAVLAIGVNAISQYKAPPQANRRFPLWAQEYLAIVQCGNAEILRARLRTVSVK